MKIVLDEDDRERVRAIVPARKTPEMARAYNLIEELMIAANEAVARIAVRHRLPAIFRVHDRPDEERVERFSGVAGLLGVEIDPLRLQTPKGVRSLLGSSRRTPARRRCTGCCCAAWPRPSTGPGTSATSRWPARRICTSPARSDAMRISSTTGCSRRGCIAAGGRPGPIRCRGCPGLRDALERGRRSSERERSVVAAERDAKACCARRTCAIGSATASKAR